MSLLSLTKMAKEGVKTVGNTATNQMKLPGQLGGKRTTKRKGHKKSKSKKVKRKTNRKKMRVNKTRKNKSRRNKRR